MFIRKEVKNIMAQDYVIEPAAAKVEVVDDLKELVGQTSAAILTDYRGLSVADLTDLRKKLRTVDAEFRVVKNTLFKRAADGQMPVDRDGDLPGRSDRDRLRQERPRRRRQGDPGLCPRPQGHLGEGRRDGRQGAGHVSQVEALSKIPSREVLISQMLGSLNSPIAGLVGTLNGILSNFVFTLQAIADTK